MENDWKCIYTSSKLSEVIMLKGMLEFNEIDCIIINKQDSLYMIGEVELYVKTEDVLSAKHFISNTEF